MGIVPGEETTLPERLRDGEEAGGRAAVVPPRPAHNLPAAMSPMVGREKELALLAARLRDPALRLVTVIGQGGVGKTRLALEAARAGGRRRARLALRPWRLPRLARGRSTA